MRSDRLRVYLSGVLILFCSLLARSQSYNATISGMVTDPSGTAVPGAQLTLYSTTRGSLAKATSGPDGLYSFPNVLPGTYELRASAKGFGEYVQTGIELTMNANVRQDVKLRMGTAVESVQVSANVTLLNTQTAEQKGSITPDVLKDLPLEVSGTIRTAANFAILMPGRKHPCANNL